jgi:S-disulfanyl-L-cysteine oxidoreductase SoxD
MKKISLAVLLLLSPALAQAWPWSRDMANQISVKPQESPDPANPGMYPFPSRSVPVPGTTVLVPDLDAAKKMHNPVVPDAQSVQKGKHLFEIYCTPCHGFKGYGDGLVGKKLIMQPFNLSYTNTMHSWQSPDYPDGYIFGYMTLGGAVMPSYANDLSPTERWNVVNYVRKVLQKAPAGYVAPQSN